MSSRRLQRSVGLGGARAGADRGGLDAAKTKNCRTNSPPPAPRSESDK